MDSEETRYKGVRKDEGKIIKGTLTEAPLKLKVASIPSKIENIVYNNHHSAAFGNSQERFYVPNNQRMEASPGPGLYNPNATSGKIDSKKGLGSFASQTKLTRFNDKRNWNPGPGRYDVLAEKKIRSRSTVLLSSQLQARELFKHEIRAATGIPGPGQYEGKTFRSITTTNPVFKSKNTRFQDRTIDNPPVGYYKWQQLKSKTKTLKFSSPTPAKNPNDSIYEKYVDKIVHGKLETTHELGPGKYNPTLIETKKTFTIKEDARDRFGLSKQAKVQKQEGSEAVERRPELATQLNGNPHNSVFKSKSKRYEFGEFQSKMVGDPAHYSPSKPNKQSHLINFSNKWV